MLINWTSSIYLLLSSIALSFNTSVQSSDANGDIPKSITLLQPCDAIVLDTLVQASTCDGLPSFPSVCSNDSSQKSIWFVIPSNSDIYANDVAFKNISMSPNYAVEVYIGAACDMIQPLKNSDFSYCNQDSSLIQIHCVDLQNNNVYIRIGSSDGGCGAFTIDASPSSCQAPSSCANVIPVGISDGYACIQSCNINSPCSNSGCDRTSHRTYYAFSVDPTMFKSGVITVNGASFSPSISIGYNCENYFIHCFPGSVSDPFSINATGLIYVAIDAFSESDEDFSVCLHVFTDDIFSCYDGDVQVTRPEYPDQNPNGPFFPNELLHFCYNINFTVSLGGTTPPYGNNCQWIQGIVPIFYNGFEKDSFPYSHQGPEGWTWLEEDIVHYNFNSNEYSYINQSDGSLGLAQGAGNLYRDGPMPKGWYYSSPESGIDCTDGTSPDSAWGLPADCGTTQNIQFCFDRRLAGVDSLGNFDGSNVSVGMFVFADGELGCWVSQSCGASSPIFWHPNSQIIDTFAISSLPKEICSGREVTINVVHNNSAIPITLIGLDNPLVTGDTIIVRDSSHISIQPVLINNSGQDQSVTYRAIAVYNNDTITRWHHVLVHPAIDVQFTPNQGFTCSGKCLDFETFISSELDTVSQFVWIGDNINLNSGSKVTICPDKSSIYTVTATDAFGCIGIGSFSITVAEDVVACSNPFDIGEIGDKVFISGNNSCGLSSQYCPQNNESTVWLSFSVTETFEMPMHVGLLGLKNGSVTLLDDQCNKIASNCNSTLVIPTLTAGKTYYFAVSSSNINAGEFRLSIDNKDFSKTISGYIYIANNSNDIYDQNDFTLRNIKLDLFSGCQNNLPSSPIATTFTNDEGIYYFYNLPLGEYTVRVDTEAPDTPKDSPNPHSCCIIITPATTGKELECDMGYPPPNCSENPYSVGNNCDEAFKNPLCDLSVIEQWPCGQIPLLPGPWNGLTHCGDNFENTSFFGFVAGTGNYQIELIIFQCAGTGVEYGIYSACEPDSGPICMGLADTGVITIDASILNPCQTYVFWIDGDQGSVCSYFVHVVGEFVSCGNQEVTSITVNNACDHVCPTSAHPFTIKAATEIYYDDLKYNWFITHPDKVKDTIKLAGLELDYVFEKIGEYEICVETPHGCGNNGNIFCQKIQSKTVEDVALDIELCTNEFPFSSLKDYKGDDVLDPNGIPWSWDQGAITQEMVANGQTNFVSQKDDGCGCSYQQTIHIQINNAKTNHYKIALCDDVLPFEFADTTFTSAVDSFKIQLDASSSLYTCDSIVFLTTQILDPTGLISQSQCENGQYTLFFIPTDSINLQNIDSLHLIWTYPNGSVTVQRNTWQDGLEIPSTVVGKFSLEIILYKFGQSCSKTLNFTTECLSSTENTSLRGKVKIIPNPAGNTISLQNNSGFKVVRFQMYNSLGAEVTTMSSDFNLMSVNHLYSGVYQCRIQFEDGRTITIPMIKM